MCDWKARGSGEGCLLQIIVSERRQGVMGDSGVTLEMEAIHGAWCCGISLKGCG